MIGDSPGAGDRYCRDVLELVRPPTRKLWDRTEPAVLLGVAEAAKWNVTAFGYSQLETAFGSESVQVFSQTQAALANREGQRQHQLSEVLAIVRQRSNDVYVFDDGFFKNPLARAAVKMPDWLSMRGGHLMLTLGGPRAGTQFHQHGASFLTLFAGRKRWYLQRPGSFPNASARALHEPVALWEEKVLPTLRHSAPVGCVQEGGETLVVPDGWAHATFNLGETVGVAWQRSELSRSPCDAGRDLFCLRLRLNKARKLGPEQRAARYAELFAEVKELMGTSPSAFLFLSQLEDYWRVSNKAMPLLQDLRQMAKSLVKAAVPHSEKAIVAATLTKLLADVVAKRTRNVTKVARMLAPAVAKAPEAGYGVDLAKAFGQLGRWDEASKYLEEHHKYFKHDKVAARMLRDARARASAKR